MRGNRGFYDEQTSASFKNVLPPHLKDHSKHSTRRHGGCFDWGLLETQARSCEL